MIRISVQASESEDPQPLTRDSSQQAQNFTVFEQNGEQAQRVRAR